MSKEERFVAMDYIDDVRIREGRAFDERADVIPAGVAEEG